MTPRAKASVCVAVLCTLLLPRFGTTALFAGADDSEARLESVREHIEEMGYSWTAGHTSISHLSPEEFGSLMGTRLPDNYDDILRGIRSRPPTFPLMDLPERFDWCDSNAVSPIRQQLCSDCWAQAVAAGMESQLRIHDHDTTLVSVQYVIDCNFGGSTCGGGFIQDACHLFKVLGALSEECYPYLGVASDCGCDTCPVIARLDGYEYIDTTVVSIKTHLMLDGPIPAALMVPPDLQYYTGGCYESEEQGPWWHAILIVGWDDSMCGNYGAWHVWSSSGTDWGEDGFGWMKYGTCKIGADAQVLHYTSKGPVRLGVDSVIVDDSSGDSDEVPDPGETIALPVDIFNAGWLTATGVSAALTTSTPGISIGTGSATFPDIEPGATEQSNPPHFAFSVASDVLCGRIAGFTVSMTSDQGVSADDFELAVSDAEVIFVDDAEDDLGWSKSVPDDDATSGRWRRRNPTGTVSDTILVQPEFDHTAGTGTKCFVTSNIMRGTVPDAADVDGGKTTLTCPAIDLSSHASALLRYWRWYTNDTGGTGDDTWAVDISPDSGDTWINLETQTMSERSWVRKEFDLAEWIPLANEVLVRFIASDYGESSIVEAAVDDFEVVGCPYWVDSLPPVAVLIGPNGGEEITEQTEFEITWSADDDYGIRETLVLASYDGGFTYTDTLGVAAWTDTALSWQVPPGEHPSCKTRIEVTDRGYNTALDESDSTFSILRDLSGVSEDKVSRAPTAIELIGSEINPFTRSTRVYFGIPSRMHVRLSVYGVQGQLIKVLVDGILDDGYQSTIWDGRTDLGDAASPGVYFIHLTASGAAKTAKLVLAR